ncbi:DUF1214 domain-containing protein [Sphingorhabdus sp. EL138]|uniref:DUF1214 domain-containing protein n=1 Tax=Sphingorhabdus sp. EL138 TaxID=2073156 RepID=UPI0025DE6FDD|nr:DUF1214 domain-containing protein [Sphingorhabdus sp. EL138]
MKTWHRYVICVALGLIGGAAYAVQLVRGGLNDGLVSSGPWETGKSFGTVDASTLTRAKVALSGLLALPAKEAMYFTATRDSNGRALDGRCTYDVRGGTLDGRWWSVTLYEGEGWLVKNAAKRWSIPASAVTTDAQGRWSFTVSPDTQSGSWLPTGSVEAFDLTLRLYHPSADIIKSPETAQMPAIDRKGCA